MPAEYEVRVTPLIRGVDGELENVFGGQVAVELADTTLITQFSDLEVNRAIGEPGTGKVVLSTRDKTPIAGSDVPGSLIASLEPFAQALWIGYKRPAETLAEGLVYGQCNVTTDYAAGTVTLDVQDPSQRCQHHYIRRGDAALNVNANQGALAANAASIDTILDAARNTPEQQTRGVPVLGMRFWEYGTLLDSVTTLIGFERGQECWDLIGQIQRSATGPDVDVTPIFAFPAWYYAELDCWDAPTDPTSPASTELGRNLDPANPDAPAAGEVVFDYGLVNDNLTALVEAPGRPTTHNHVVDADKAYRKTAADADSSYAVGVWVDWTETDFKVPRPTRATPTADTSVLQALADARIKAYGVPPKFFTCTLRPDDAQARHYGHRYWDLGTANGDWYLGDYVRVRAQDGFCSFSTLARITGVTFHMDGSNGLPILDVHMIPAIGGSPGPDPEDA
jgi:hypothetical protein